MSNRNAAMAVRSENIQKAIDGVVAALKPLRPLDRGIVLGSTLVLLEPDGGVDETWLRPNHRRVMK